MLYAAILLTSRHSLYSLKMPQPTQLLQSNLHSTAIEDQPPGERRQHSSLSVGWSIVACCVDTIGLFQPATLLPNSLPLNQASQVFLQSFPCCTTFRSSDTFLTLHRGLLSSCFWAVGGTGPRKFPAFFDT